MKPIKDRMMYVLVCCLLSPLCSADDALSMSTHNDMRSRFTEMNDDELMEANVAFQAPVVEASDGTPQVLTTPGTPGDGHINTVTQTPRVEFRAGQFQRRYIEETVY